MVNQIFPMTYNLVIIHHNTKFSKKWLSSSGDTEQTRSDIRTELQTDRRTDRQSDSNIPPTIWGWGGYKYRAKLPLEHSTMYTYMSFQTAPESVTCYFKFSQQERWKQDTVHQSQVKVWVIVITFSIVRGRGENEGEWTKKAEIIPDKAVNETALFLRGDAIHMNTNTDMVKTKKVETK